MHTAPAVGGPPTADPERVGSVVTQLQAFGVGFSVDDYGTGYSSLSYLRDLLVRELKLDRSFVMGIAENPSDQAIVGATVSLAPFPRSALGGRGGRDALGAGPRAAPGSRSGPAVRHQQTAMPGPLRRLASLPAGEPRHAGRRGLTPSLVVNGRRRTGCARRSGVLPGLSNRFGATPPGRRRCHR